MTDAGTELKNLLGRIHSTQRLQAGAQLPPYVHSRKEDARRQAFEQKLAVTLARMMIDRADIEKHFTINDGPLEPHLKSHPAFLDDWRIEMVVINRPQWRELHNLVGTLIQLAEPSVAPPAGDAVREKALEEALRAILPEYEEMVDAAGHDPAVGIDCSKDFENIERARNALRGAS